MVRNCRESGLRALFGSDCEANDLELIKKSRPSELGLPLPGSDTTLQSYQLLIVMSF